jgi:adenylyl-sulfate kinase
VSEASRGFTIFFTGLPAAGKSTISRLLFARLKSLGHRVELLDGDAERARNSVDLDFSWEHRKIHIKRIGYICELLARHDVIAIAAVVSAVKEARDEVRSHLAPRFLEVFCDCPIEVVKARDPKGLYRKATSGEIRQFIGVDAPYEPPDRPEVHLRTERQSPEQCVEGILARATELGLLAAPARGRSLDSTEGP